MNVELTWPAIAVVISILMHGGFTIWWASKITSQIDTLINSFNRIDKELSAVWKRVDAYGNRITAVEYKCNISHNEQ